MIVVDYRPHHLRLIKIQAAQEAMASMITVEYALLLKNAGPAYTVLDDDGEVLFCCGTAKQWEGRFVVWSVLSKFATKKKFVWISRKVKSYFDKSDIRRLEMTIDVGFDQGVRWAELLGFKRECKMEKFNPDGTDAWLFSRVK